MCPLDVMLVILQNSHGRQICKEHRAHANSTQKLELSIAELWVKCANRSTLDWTEENIAAEEGLAKS